MFVKSSSLFALAGALLFAGAQGAPLEARQIPGGAPLHVIALKPGSNKTQSSSNQVATFNNFSTLVSGLTGNSNGFGVNVVSKATDSTPEVIQLFLSGVTCVGAHLDSGASSIKLVSCEDTLKTHFYSRPYTVDGVKYRQLEVVGDASKGDASRRNVHIVSSGEVHFYTESPSYPQRLYYVDANNTQ